MECSTYNGTAALAKNHEWQDRHTSRRKERERKRKDEGKERERGIYSRYFSFLFKVLWKINKLLAQFHPRQLWNCGSLSKRNSPLFQEKEDSSPLENKDTLNVLERWTDSRCLKLDCVRDRKKVTSSVNEKQKTCGSSVSFSGTSSVSLHWIGWKGFVISKQTLVYSPATFFLSVFVSPRLSICFSPSFFTSCTLSTQTPKLTGQQSFKSSTSLSCHALWKTVKDLPDSAHPGSHLESLS